MTDNIMTQVTLNIPDSELDFFMKLIQKFNYTTVNETDTFTSQSQKDILDERRATENPSSFLTVEQTNQKIKEKYGF